MEIKLRRSLFVMLNEAISLILAVSVILLSLSVVFLSCFQTPNFVKKNFYAYSDQTINCVNERLGELSETTGFPSEAYTNCFDEDFAKMVLDKLINNINYTYATSFSDDEEIYHMFKTNLTNYCYDNGIDVTSDEISAYSSLAVDEINEIFCGNGTANIQVMKIVLSRKMIAFIAVPALLIIACFILLDQLNKGRHRRFNFSGMGITIAGSLMSFVSLFIILKGYIQKYQFCPNNIIDSAIGDITTSAMKICVAIGIVYLIVGFIIILNNYLYYRTKRIEMKEIRANKDIEEDELNEDIEKTE